MYGPDRQPLEPPPRVSRQLAAVVAVLIVSQALLLVVLIRRTSVVVDEVGHLAAGVSIWQLNRFDLYCVNPPLVRAVAAIPVVLDAPDFDWPPFGRHPFLRQEWAIGRQFVEASGEDWFQSFVRARSWIVPFVLIGGGVCFVWARALYGDAAGIVALILWCFSPNILAWGATITPDAAAASFGVMAGWLFWRWLREPGWAGTFLTGLLLGLANLTKLTWVVLFALWPLLWGIWRWTQRGNAPGDPRPAAIQLGAILGIGLYVLNSGYGFEGSMKPLGEYRFVSQMLTGSPSESGQNRIAALGLGELPVPLPENWLRGLDLQKLDFEQGKWSFLRGEWRHGGWWYYYLYCAAMKVPLGCWLLAFLAGIDRLRSALLHRRSADAASTGTGVPDGRCGTGWRDELVLLAPAVTVFVLVSSQTGFSRYFRYVLPCFPFVFIWMSSAGRALRRPASWSGVHWTGSTVRVAPARWLAPGVVLALLWFTTSSLQVFPHSMSYFNQLAGGPENGHWHVLHANVDWGQDMWALKEWQDRHPETQPLKLAHASVLPPRLYGIEATGVSLRPEAGWYAISLHRLHDRDGRFRWLLDGPRPVQRIGYSMNIYHVTAEDVASAENQQMHRRPVIAALRNHW